MTELKLALQDTGTEILHELPALPAVVKPVVLEIGTRMIQPDAKDAKDGARLLAIVKGAAKPALAGVAARLPTADTEETYKLLEVVTNLGRQARSLKKPIIESALRNTNVTYTVLQALRAMRVKVSAKERRQLKQAYSVGCVGPDDCEPFSRVFP